MEGVSGSIGTKPPPDPNSLVFGLIMFAGLCCALSPVYYFFRGSHTDYAITESRAIVRSSFMFPFRIAVPFDQLSAIDVKASSPGRGHVLFLDRNPQNFSRSLFRGRDGFVAIRDAVPVGQMLKAAIEKATARRPAGRTLT